MSEYEYNPGSEEAREQGCSCPVLDNSHGKGYMGTDSFVISFDCQIHSEEKQWK